MFQASTKCSLVAMIVSFGMSSVPANAQEGYIGEIRILPYDFCPEDWSQLNGQQLDPSQNAELFSVIGDTYGGNGRTVFRLPNSQGRVLVHEGAGYPLGAVGGIESQPDFPAHSHDVQGSSLDGDSESPLNRVFGSVPSINAYAGGELSEVMHPATVSTSNGPQAVTNIQPSLGIQSCIAVDGLYPSRPSEAEAAADLGAEDMK
ncbi:MAG: tail fiber protein [Pseudomonadota bacterium]